MTNRLLGGAVVAVVAAAGTGIVGAQDGPPLPTLEVVSVRANRSNAEAQSMRLQPGGRIVITNSPLRPLILTAYGLLPQQLSGGPAWIDSDRFDVLAQASENLPPSPPGGPPGPAQLLMQRLLAERFKLATHFEKRELQIYALVVARDDGRLGPGMVPAKADCMALMAAYGRGAAPLPPRSECGISGGPGRVSARGASLPMFARSVLAAAANQIVEDRTGLIGGYDFDLEFVAEPLAVGSATGVNGASLFTALEEQLGLKLRAVRAPVDVLIIDRVEQPTEN
jgi:uncharacterized protein (TIGR03435 family)